MAKKVNSQPAIPRPNGSTQASSLAAFDAALVKALFVELVEHAARLNIAALGDGTEVPSAPMRLRAYQVADLPSASLYANGLIAVVDDIDGYNIAYSDGFVWRRASDRQVVS